MRFYYTMGGFKVYRLFIKYYYLNLNVHLSIILLSIILLSIILLSIILLSIVLLSIILLSIILLSIILSYLLYSYLIYSLIYIARFSLHYLFCIISACTDTFDRTNKTLSPSGVLMSGQSTIDACTAYCLAMANCWHFDFNRATSECFSHPMGSVVTYKSVTVDQFTRVKCTAATTTVTTTR